MYLLLFSYFHFYYNRCWIYVLYRAQGRAPYTSVQESETERDVRDKDVWERESEKFIAAAAGASVED